MNAKHFAEVSAFVSLQEQLRVVAQQLNAGMDVAPAQRLQLEGFVAALIAGGVAIEVLEQACTAAGAGVVKIARDGAALHFDCWQQRAPVYPTTAD